MPTLDTLQDAAWYTIVGILFALLTMRMRRDLRKGTVQMVVIVLVGVGALYLHYRYGALLTDSMLALIVREVILLIIAFGVVRIILTSLFEVLLARAAVPRILADVLFSLVLVIYAVYRMHVGGVNLASIITTSAVLTGVIGFSLQATLGNLWGGIALQLDNTCRIGDWIRVDNVSGQIVGIRWRYLSVATNSGETVIVPNATLVANRVTVLARRGDARVPWRRDVEFSVTYRIPPSRVMKTIQTALLRSEIANVATQPPLAVLCRGFGDSAIHYVVRYWLTDLRFDEVTDSEVRLHLFAALSREQMEIPFPHRVVIDGGSIFGSVSEEKVQAERLSVLGGLELFAPLTDAERAALATELADVMFVDHDIISRTGEVAEALYVLARGTVGIYTEGSAVPGTPGRHRLATLKAPAYFGEMGLLTGQARTATVIAESDVLCYRLDKSGFDAIMRARPELAESLSRVVAARQAENDATLQAADAEARARMAVSRATDLVRRIRQFFDITD